MTSPWMTDELAILREHTHRFFQNEFVPHTERWIERGMCDREAWSKLGEVGLLCASIPEDYGGGGGDFRHEAVIYEEEVRSGAPGIGIAVHNAIVAHYLLHYATEGQKKRWLPKMASGELVGAICMTEPNTGSDLQAVKTRAIRDGDEYVIHGQKTFVTNGQHADLIVVVCKTDPDKGARGISLLVVEAPVHGLKRGRNLKKLGLEANDTSELFFEDVRVPADNLLGGAEGRGFVQLMQQLPQERLAIAVAAVAVMERALSLTIDYVKERKAFGKRILDFQNTRFELAECRTEAHIARVFLDDCIIALTRGELNTERASMAKYWCTEKQCQIVDRCLQLFGGYGFMLEYPIARLYADSRVQKIYGGTNEIMKEMIARSFDRET